MGWSLDTKQNTYLYLPLSHFLSILTDAAALISSSVTFHRSQFNSHLLVQPSPIQLATREILHSSRWGGCCSSPGMLYLQKMVQILYQCHVTSSHSPLQTHFSPLFPSVSQTDHHMKYTNMNASKCLLGLPPQSPGSFLPHCSKLRWMLMEWRIRYLCWLWSIECQISFIFLEPRAPGYRLWK